MPLDHVDAAIPVSPASSSPEVKPRLAISTVSLSLQNNIKTMQSNIDTDFKQTLGKIPELLSKLNLSGRFGFLIMIGVATSLLVFQYIRRFYCETGEIDRNNFVCSELGSIINADNITSLIQYILAFLGITAAHSATQARDKSPQLIAHAVTTATSDTVAGIDMLVDEFKRLDEQNTYLSRTVDRLTAQEFREPRRSRSIS